MILSKQKTLRKRAEEIVGHRPGMYISISFGSTRLTTHKGKAYPYLCRISDLHNKGKFQGAANIEGKAIKIALAKAIKYRFGQEHFYTTDCFLVNREAEVCPVCLKPSRHLCLKCEELTKK
jgi:hypothetical protein